jgi:hypothetical protein
MRAGVTSAFSYDANGERVSISKGGTTHTYARNPHGDISLLLNEAGSATASYGYRPYGDKDTGLFAEPGHTETNPLNPTASTTGASTPAPARSTWARASIRPMSVAFYSRTSTARRSTTLTSQRIH